MILESNSSLDPEAVVRLLLKQGSMLRAGVNVFFPSTTSHCIILVNPYPNEEDILVFASVTSQYEKRINYAEKLALPTNTIVMIRPGSYSHLPHYTAVDCNTVHIKSLGQLVSLYSQGKVSFYTEDPIVNTEHLRAIVQGIIDSPIIEGEVVNMLSSSDILNQN